MSLGQPKIFRCGSLCCCVGDYVVGHCHLYPLHSWQDILLTFAEMELDSTAMFPSGTSVMFIRSMGEPVYAQVVGHSEQGDAYRRITYDRDGKTVLHDCASVRRLSLPHSPPPRMKPLGVCPCRIFCFWQKRRHWVCAHAKFITFGRTEGIGCVPMQNLLLLAELKALGVCPCKIYYFWQN